MEDLNNDQELTKKPAFKTLIVDSVKYRTLFNEKHKLRKPYVKKDERKITAFIPGTIREVFVKSKKKIKAGENLLVLEAMKMKNVLIAPFDGVVKSVNVKTGDRVSKDQVLVEIE
ncbi:MAG: acetyl-CoA carboxylase biotin carboxyl carrier protein subunit [Bacteroidales bacterium]